MEMINFSCATFQRLRHRASDELMITSGFIGFEFSLASRSSYWHSYDRRLDFPFSLVSRNNECCKNSLNLGLGYCRQINNKKESKTLQEIMEESQSTVVLPLSENPSPTHELFAKTLGAVLLLFSLLSSFIASPESPPFCEAHEKFFLPRLSRLIDLPSFRADERGRQGATRRKFFCALQTQFRRHAEFYHTVAVRGGWAGAERGNKVDGNRKRFSYLD